MPESGLDVPNETQRRLRLGQRLGWITWLLVSGALAWFIARERLPEWFAARPGAVPILLGSVGALGGAMLVGARLALSSAGGRPPLRDMILMIAAPAFFLFLGSMLLNRFGGGESKTFVGPIADLVVMPEGEGRSSVSVLTLSPEGKTQWRRVLHDAEHSEVMALLGPAGYDKGACVRYRYKTGSMGMEENLGGLPVPCPPSKGEHAPDGPLMVEVPDPAKPQEWRWSYETANEGPNFDAWHNALTELAFRHITAVDNKRLTFRARLEPDGSISAAELITPDILPSVAEELSGSLVGTKNVLELPKTVRTQRAMWVMVPGSTMVSLSPHPPGNEQPSAGSAP